ncbi:hypothetical protein BB347_16950 (plasmid) [Natronorubrum daqingense]|nr:hypothetical protein BB347_16950 [Natronorubrum daqingense]
MTQTLQTVECVPESDKFEEHLNGYEQRNYNAGVVGIWSSDNFHEADFQGYVSDVGIHRKERGTYEIAVLGNRELNKLARLAKEYNRLKNDYNNDSDEVYFYYPSMADKPFPDKQDSLALEALLSDLIFVQIKRASGYDRENTPTGFERVNVIFYFGDFTLDSLEVVFKALVEYNLLDVEEVLIYYDNEHLDRGIQDIESAKAQFANTIIPDNGEIVEDKEIPKFDFDTLPSVTYDNYTEGLRGDDNA